MHALFFRMASQMDNLGLIDADQCEDPKGVLEAIFEYLDIDFWKTLAEHTNLYSVQMRNHRSVKTTYQEMIRLAGIHVLMGSLKLPQVRMYWSQDLSMPAVNEHMSRDRFFELRNYLHFADNSIDRSSCTDNDRLWKIRPLIEPILTKCRSLPKPHHISLDEQMIPFAGRCGFRQYVPSKPNPLGLKNFVMAAWDGLVLDFHIYTGKGTVCEEDMKELGLGAGIVKLLSKTVPRDGKHVIYTDRFFTSIKSAEYLLSIGIHQTGTVMKNRVGPVIDKLKNDKLLKRGEWDERVRDDDKVCLLKWKDNKSVILLSTCVGSEPRQSCMRWSKDAKKKIEVDMPAVVSNYNKFMGGTDLCDRYIAYYRSCIRTRKWPVRVFNHFVDLVIVNCWVMYRRIAAKNGNAKKDVMSLLQFRLHAGKAMAKYEVAPIALAARRPGRPHLESDSDESDVEAPARKYRRVVSHPISEIRYDRTGHFPQFTDDKNASKCRNPGCKSRSRIICVKCKIFLCILKNNCFIKYHEK